MKVMENLTPKERAILSYRIEELDVITNALSEQDILMELWQREEKSSLAPAGKWTNEYVIAESFKFRVFVYLFISIMLVVPMFFYIPYLVAKFIERKNLKAQIIQERVTIRSSSPIPIVGEGDFSTLEGSYWGKRLIDEGIIYKSNLENPMS